MIVDISGEIHGLCMEVEIIQEELLFIKNSFFSSFKKKKKIVTKRPLSVLSTMFCVTF